MLPMTAAQLQRIFAPTPPLSGATFVCEAPRQIELAHGFAFHPGQRIAPYSIVYETYGELDADGSNAILVCHALSPGAHCAGKYTADDAKAGWWDGMVGYGKGIDLRKHFVVCVNFPGSPWGTSAPRTPDPATGKPYG